MITPLRYLGLGALSLLCLSSSIRAADDNGYAVVVSQATYADRAWRPVADALIKKHNGTLITYTGSVTNCRAALAKLMPRYTAFVAEPGELGRVFIAEVHRMTRTLNEDPYGDTLWGVVSAATAKGALRMAQATEPRTIRRVMTLTGMDHRFFNQYFGISDSRAGDWVWKQANGSITNGADGKADRTSLFMRHWNDMSPDLLLGSGHATEQNLEMCFSQGNTFSKAGFWWVKPMEGKPVMIPANGQPRVFLGAGNCLIGNFQLNSNSMAATLINNYGFNQFVGYTVPTWYGEGGWGTLGYWQQLPGRYSLAEAWFFNNQRIIHKLARLGPLTKSSLTISEAGHGIPFQEIANLNKDTSGMLWDRDVVAFYGDPALRVCLTDPNPPADLSTRITCTGQVWTLSVTVGSNIQGIQSESPLCLWLPHRIGPAVILDGASLDPVVTSHYIMIMKPDYRTNTHWSVTFRERD